MAQQSDFAMVHSIDQWRRLAYENVALVEEGDDLASVQLNWLVDERVDNDSEDKDLQRAGLAFDPWCRLYRSVPEQGQIERSLWASENPEVSEPLGLFSSEFTEMGDFITSSVDDFDAGPLSMPSDVLVDQQGRLFIAESGRHRVLVFDLVDHKLLQKNQFQHAPIKLACDGKKVWVLFAAPAAELAILKLNDEPLFEPLPATITAPISIAIDQGQVYLLTQGGTAEAMVIPLTNPGDAFVVPYAQEMLFEDGNILVVARRQAEDFLRYKLSASGQTELPHYKARNYDGRGIVVTPDGHVAYWSKNGLLRATLARVRYQMQGRVTSFQLDSDDFQTQWGRLFIDACIPRGTSISAQFLVLDEVPETTTPIPRSAPEKVINMTLIRPDLSPPMPPQELLTQLPEPQGFHRRHNGQEFPWQVCQDDLEFQTYEAPIIAPSGRFLWVLLHLQGTARLTPKVKSLRAEYPAHDWLRRLPQVYSRETVLADFLQRYLAIPEGEMRDLDIRASYRHLLLDPYATPAALLPWLGGFMGMMVDQRWPESAQRHIIANAIWLFRFRGTVMGLKRFIEIFLGIDPSEYDAKIVTIVEHFKVRGLGGGFVGESDALLANSVLGAGFRIGGKLGQQQSESINEVSIEDAITSHAHRFSLIIAASLDSEQLAVIEHLLEMHRPAHTLYDICTVDAGMRVGNGLYMGLTTMIGPTSGFGQLQLGGSLLGRTDTVGKAKAGTTIGGSRLGNDTRVG